MRVTERSAEAYAGRVTDPRPSGACPPPHAGQRFALDGARTRFISAAPAELHGKTAAGLFDLREQGADNRECRAGTFLVRKPVGTGIREVSEQCLRRTIGCLSREETAHDA